MTARFALNPASVHRTAGGGWVRFLRAAVGGGLALLVASLTPAQNTQHAPRNTRHGLRPAPEAEHPNRLLWRTNYYSVTGASIREIRRSMDHSRPWKEANHSGRTEWRLEWRCEVTPEASGCRCSSFATTTTITNTLPRWTPPAAASDELKTAWVRFVKALGEHEDGHSRFALEAVADMHKRIKQLGPAPDCHQLRRRIDDLAGRVLEEYRQREKEYDRRTQHGAAQGVILR